MHAEFKLPDDFDGTIPDALRLLADYWDTPEADLREKMNDDHPDWIGSKDISVGDWESNALQRLTDKNIENGSRVVFCNYLGDWDDEEKPEN